MKERKQSKEVESKRIEPEEFFLIASNQFDIHVMKYKAGVDEVEQGELKKKQGLKGMNEIQNMLAKVGGFQRNPDIRVEYSKFENGALGYDAAPKGTFGFKHDKKKRKQ